MLFFTAAILLCAVRDAQCKIKAFNLYFRHFIAFNILIYLTF